MELNVITVTVDGFSKITSCPLYQWDYGQILKIEGITLPGSYEVHFSQASANCTVLGDSDGVQIPDAYLQIASDITAYLYLHQGEDDGETVYQITIPVIARPKPSNGAPTPVQVDVITQAIATLNTAIEDCGDAVTDAQGYAHDASESADQAAASARDAAESAATLDQEHIDAMVQEYLDTHPIDAPVTSVNSKTGDVVLDASDVGALPDSTVIPSKTSQLDNDSGFITSAVTSFNGSTGAVTYTAPVSSVNSKTGAVALTASDVGAYVKPGTGIPKSDLASAVQTSLGKADTALQSAPVTSVNTKTGAVTLSASDVGAYVKPSGGIPKTDLASAVQTSLGKADTALQSAPVTSVNGQTGAVTLSIPSSASDVGAIASPATPTAGDFLVWNGSAWVAMSLSTWQGGSY